MLQVCEAGRELYLSAVFSRMRGLSLSFARKYAVKVTTLAKQVRAYMTALKSTTIPAHGKAELSSIHAKEGMPAASHTFVRLAV